MQLHDNIGVYTPSILAQLHEGATAKCPDIGRMQGRAAAQLERISKVCSAACLFTKYDNAMSTLLKHLGANVSSRHKSSRKLCFLFRILTETQESADLKIPRAP